MNNNGDQRLTLIGVVVGKIATTMNPEDMNMLLAGRAAENPVGARTMPVHSASASGQDRLAAVLGAAPEQGRPRLAAAPAQGGLAAAPAQGGRRMAQHTRFDADSDSDSSSGSESASDPYEEGAPPESGGRVQWDGTHIRFAVNEDEVDNSTLHRWSGPHAQFARAKGSKATEDSGGEGEVSDETSREQEEAEALYTDIWEQSEKFRVRKEQVEATGRTGRARFTKTPQTQPAVESEGVESEGTSPTRKRTRRSYPAAHRHRTRAQCRTHQQPVEVASTCRVDTVVVRLPTPSAFLTLTSCRHLISQLGQRLQLSPSQAARQVRAEQR